MPEVDAADARRRDHRATLRERDADVLGTEQVEELPLLTVVRAGGIPEGRPDAAEALRDQLLGRERAALLVPLPPRDLVQGLGGRLGQPGREPLPDDRAGRVLRARAAGAAL